MAETSDKTNGEMGRERERERESEAAFVFLAKVTLSAESNISD